MRNATLIGNLNLKYNRRRCASLVEIRPGFISTAARRRITIKEIAKGDEQARQWQVIINEACLLDSHTAN